MDGVIPYEFDLNKGYAIYLARSKRDAETYLKEYCKDIKLEHTSHMRVCELSYLPHYTRNILIRECLDRIHPSRIRKILNKEDWTWYVFLHHNDLAKLDEIKQCECSVRNKDTKILFRVKEFLKRNIENDNTTYKFLDKIYNGNKYKVLYNIAEAEEKNFLEKLLNPALQIFSYDGIRYELQTKQVAILEHNTTMCIVRHMFNQLTLV